MSFLSKLFGGKSERTPAQPVVTAAVKDLDERVEADTLKSETADVIETPPASEDAVLKSVANRVESVAAAKDAAVNIWDMDDDESAEVAVDAPVKNRRRRNATRLIGFDTSDGEATDLFEQEAVTTNHAAMQFPTGWLLVVEGEGRGYCFGLTSGLNQVGRGAENSIQLDFGDTAVSRKNHFAVVFDEEERKFVLGHGGKSNIIRLNGKAVISNEDLADGDQIKVGGTVLQLKTLCGEDFDWTQSDSAEEDEDVAIA